MPVITPFASQVALLLLLLLLVLVLLLILRLNGHAGSLLHTEEKLEVPPITWRPKEGEAISTQIAFGHIMFELAKVREPNTPAPSAHEAATTSRLSRKPRTRPLLAD